jgi:hypothetical protein
MNRLLALLIATTVLAGAAAFVVVFAARAGERTRTLTVNAGDIVRVAGTANVGCRVRRHDGFETLDCRRAGPLTGTYGALLNKKEIIVIRFQSAKVAKIVFSARHRSTKITRCS